MDKDKKIIKVPTLKILIIITSIQFLITNALLTNKKTIGNLETNDNSENKNNILKIKKIKYLYKEDNNTYIKTNKTEIHIAMAFDTRGIYPTLVSVTSALENNNNNKNILVYHYLLSHNFEMEKLKILESLKEIYDFRANYYIIPNFFKNMRKWRNSDIVFYKLLIPFIFPDFDRIIFLDSDTLIFTDISEMFFLPFNEAYVLGYPFHTANALYRFGIHSKKYINGGVLLINIKKIIKDGKDLELLNFTMKNGNNFTYLEQDTINYVYFNKIGLLPLKYGIYLYGNINKEIYMPKMEKLDIEEIKRAIDSPSIVHLCCCNPKVWYKNSKHEKKFNNICERFQKEFYFYASKTKYYNEIYNKYMQG